MCICCIKTNTRGITYLFFYMGNLTCSETLTSLLQMCRAGFMPAQKTTKKSQIRDGVTFSCQAYEAFPELSTPSLEFAHFLVYHKTVINFL